MTRTIGVVIPAYRPVVDVLAAYVDSLEATLSPATIRIELDDPDPATLEALAGLPATVNVVETRRGKGGAITAGFEALETDVLAFADADGATPASSMAAVVDAIGSDLERSDRSSVENRPISLAVGSRRHPDADVRAHQSIVRRRLGDWFALLARRSLEPSLYDYQCGAKAIDRAAWEAVRAQLSEPGFGWDVELIAYTHAMDYRLAEVPIAWEDEPQSTVGPVRAGVELARALVRSRRRATDLRRVGRHGSATARRRRRLALLDRLEVDPDPDARTTDE